MSFIAKQVDEAIENSKNLTLHRDATTKLGRHKTVIEGVLRI
jgi:hypothetical protein